VSMTLMERVAECMAARMSAHEIAAAVSRPVKQVRMAMDIIRHPDLEAARQAAYYAKRRSDPEYMERKREAARRSNARKRGVQTNDRGYATRQKSERGGEGG
jgi:hypothetical protein